MDPYTGRVLALSGGFSFKNSEFNRASQALRQPGSAFKPFVYATALENNYKPTSLFQIEEINSANDKSARKVQEEKLQKIITESKNLCWLKITNSAIPGLAIAVSVDGKTLFRHGFGYADVENKVLATASHVFRIGK
mgnify:CR=1 FL=1